MVIESTALAIAIGAATISVFQAIKEIVSRYVKRRGKAEIQIEIDGQKLTISLNDTEEAAKKLEQITSLLK